jgi:protein-L-isoaspartate(D-aspartate) O-methyltransferase
MASAELYAEARRQMVLTQLRPNKVIDEQLIAAMAGLPREDFVPLAYRGVAYMDEDVTVGPGRYLLEPMVLARLLQEAEIQSTDKALVIGAATGYDVAVLAGLAASVAGIDSDTALVDQATRGLKSLGITNATVSTGSLSAGLAAAAPFDVILLAGAVPEVPEALLKQLADGGRLIGVVRGPGAPIGQAVLVRRVGDLFPQRILFDAGTPTLPGFDRQAGFVF